MLQMNIAQLGAMGANLLACTKNAGSTNLGTLSIYKGTIPTVDGSFSWTPSTYAAQLLYSIAPIATKAITSGAYTIGFTLNAAMTGKLATGTGTATWFALHNGAAGVGVLIGTVSSNVNNTDPLLLSTTSLSSGTAFNILDLTVKFLG